MDDQAIRDGFLTVGALVAARFSRTDERLLAISDQVVEIKLDLAGLKDAMAEGFAKHDREFDLVRRQMAQFQNRVADRFDEHDKRFAAIEQGIEQGLGALETRLTAEIRALAAEVRAFGQRPSDIL